MNCLRCTLIMSYKGVNLIGRNCSVNKVCLVPILHLVVIATISSVIQGSTHTQIPAPDKKCLSSAHLAQSTHISVCRNFIDVSFKRDVFL